MAGADNGEFIGLSTAEPEVEEIGHVEEGLGCGQQGRTGLDHGEQLVEAVDLHELNAGAFIDLDTRHDLEGNVHHAVSAAIAVVVGVTQERIVGGEQSKIDTPSVETDTGQVIPAGPGRQPKSVLDLGPEAQHIPVQAVDKPHGPVGETVNLFEAKAIVLKMTDDGAAAFGTQVDGKVSGHVFPPGEVDKGQVHLPTRPLPTASPAHRLH